MASGVALLAFCPAALAANHSTAAYVVDNAQNQILQFSVGDNGTLTPDNPATAPTGSAPTSIALSPDGKSAYVTNFLSGGHGGPVNNATVSQFDVAANGTLTPKDPATVDLRITPTADGFFPEVVAETPNGKTVYVATDDGFTPNFTDQIYVFNVGTGGKLSPATPNVVDVGPGQPNGTGQLQSMVVSKDGKSLYWLSSGTSIGGDGNVYQFNIEPNGKLSPKTPSMVATGPVPVWLALGANGESLYVTNADYGSYDGGVGSISQYAIAANGTLTPNTPATVATGTNIYDPNSFPKYIAVNPDGRSALVLTSSSILRYTLAPNGTLNANPKSLPFGAFPLDAGGTIADAYSADGKYAYVTNQGGGFVAGSGYAVGSDGPAVVSQYTNAPLDTMGLNSPPEVLTGAPYVTFAFPYEIVLNGQ